MKKQKNKILFPILDTIIILFSFLVSFLLRFDFEIPNSVGLQLTDYAPVILFSKLFSLFVLAFIREFGYTLVCQI